MSETQDVEPAAADAPPDGDGGVGVTYTEPVYGEPGADVYPFSDVDGGGGPQPGDDDAPGTVDPQGFITRVDDQGETWHDAPDGGFSYSEPVYGEPPAGGDAGDAGVLVPGSVDPQGFTTRVDDSGQVWYDAPDGGFSYSEPVYGEPPADGDAGNSASGIPGDPTGGGDGQMSGEFSTTVYPDGTAVDDSGGSGYVDGAGGSSGWESTTVNPDGSSVSLGTGTFPDDGEDGLGDLSGIDLSGVNDVVGDALESGVPIGATASAAYDLIEGNYDGAAEEGLIGAADVGADALGLPGIDGDIGVLTDLADGNTGALLGDTETAAIETGAGIAGAAIGSVLGPVGTVAGAAIGNFVGGAVAPAVENAVSDTVNTVGDVVGDTETAFSNADTDFSDGDILGGVGDIAGGVADDVGDVATGAVDVAGDAVEGAGDVVSAVGGLVGDVGSGVADVAGDVEEGADDVGDALEDVGDDIESLF